MRTSCPHVPSRRIRWLLVTGFSSFSVTTARVVSLLHGKEVRLPTCFTPTLVLTIADLYLTVGPQVTTTYTPTVTMSVITTPTITQTDTTTSTDTITTGPFSTVTMPSGTASKIKTITPKPVTTTSTKTMTRTKVSTTKTVTYTTKTVTPTCTTKPHTGKPDKPCQYSPTKIHPAALVTPTVIPQARRWAPRADRVADVEWVRARIEAARERREAKKQLNRRAPDAPTSTVTLETPVSATVTETAPATTTTETVLQTTQTTLTIPPPTVLSGILTRTTTLPTPTKTKVKFTYTTTTTTKTYAATFTRTSTAPPSASVTQCKKHGGNYWWN